MLILVLKGVILQGIYLEILTTLILLILRQTQRPISNQRIFMERRFHIVVAVRRPLFGLLVLQMET